MDKPYLEQMRAHVDEGGKLTHQNAHDLLRQVEKLSEFRDRLDVVFAPSLHWDGPAIRKILQAEYDAIVLENE
jgi:hypothetical protein